MFKVRVMHKYAHTSLTVAYFAIVLLISQQMEPERLITWDSAFGAAGHHIIKMQHTGRNSTHTFADAVFVSIIVLILVELAEKSRSALHPVHPGHCAVTVLTSTGCTDLTTAAVVQDRPCAPLRPAAPLRVASVGAVHRVLDIGAPRISIVH